MTDTVQTAATFPRLLLQHAKVRPNAAAIREKDLGIWQTLTWGDLHNEVETIAAGLLDAGIQRGAHIALIGENRPRLYATMCAAQSIGAIPVPLYQDAVAQEMVFVFQFAEIAYALVEDQEQVDKLLEISEQCPLLTHIWFDDPRGMRHYTQPRLQSYDGLLDRGRAYAASHPGFLQAAVEMTQGDDVAAMFFTSGTTGNPKGVIHTHNSLIIPSRTVSNSEHLSDHDDVLAYLPLAWIGQNIFSYAQWLICGFTVNCPESSDTVTADMREIGPTYYFAPPRVLEALLTQVTIRMEDAGAFQRWAYKTFMEVARRVGGRILDKEPGVSVFDRLKYAIGSALVYAPLRNALGMSRIRLAYTAGEAIGPDLFVFYRSLGINLKQLYGSTETAVWVCVQPDGAVRAESVGKPVEGVEVRINDNGEIVVRSPGLLREYYRNPEATAEVKDNEGWYHTGDAGFFEHDGQLRIIDRAKDVGKLADGTLFAPKYIENKLKFFPFIKEAVAFGQGESQVCAFINIDVEACGNWAERRNLPYSGYTDLAGKAEISDMIRDCVEKVNVDLAADPMLANSQVHRFLILHKELDADDGELTRTRKVRRGAIAQKYEVLVKALYGGLKECYIETQVKFEDGRTGMISATLKIHDAKIAPTVSQKKAA